MYKRNENSACFGHSYRGTAFTAGFGGESDREDKRDRECKIKVVIPGNHDARNVGDLCFEEIFGLRSKIERYEEIFHNLSM